MRASPCPRLRPRHRPRFLPRHFGLILPLLSFTLWGCDSDPSPLIPPEPPPDPNVVGVTGGTVATPDGSAGVTVPPGALPAGVRITVQPQEAAAAATPVVGAAYRLEPSGTQFAVPATLRLRFPEGAFREGTDLSRLQLARLEDGVWVPRGDEIQVNPTTREVQGKIAGFSTWGVWVDPCIPRQLNPAAGARSETLVADDCLFQAGEVTRRSQYFDFNLTQTTAIDFSWSGAMDFIAGLKEATEDPTVGTVWGSLLADAATDRAARLRTILAPGAYQLYLSGTDENQLGAYQLTPTVRSVAEMTAGQGCSGFTLLVPGTSVTGAKLDEAEGDCVTTVQFSPDPNVIGQPLVLDRYIVRLRPGETYTVTVNRTDGTWAPALSVFAGGQLRAQRIPDGSSSLSLELVPPALTYYTLEVSAAAPVGETLPVVGYSISVSGGSGPVSASVVIPSGPVELTVPGDTVHARAQVTRSGAPVQGAQVRWESLNPDIARVSANGVVTAVAEGTTTLRASWGAGTATVPVTVDPTKLALRSATPRVDGGDQPHILLRAGRFDPEGMTIRFNGEPIPFEVLSDRVARVFVPFGPGGTYPLEVRQGPTGTPQEGSVSFERGPSPVITDPRGFVGSARGELEAAVVLVADRNPYGGADGAAQAAQLQAYLQAQLDSTTAVLAELSDAQLATVAGFLARFQTLGADPSPASASSGPDVCQTSGTGAAQQCLEKTNRKLALDLARLVLYVAMIGGGWLLVKSGAAAAPLPLASVLSAVVGTSVAGIGLIGAISVLTDSFDIANKFDSTAVLSGLGLDFDSAPGLGSPFLVGTEVSGLEPGATSGAVLSFQSGIPLPLPLVVTARSPVASDTDVPAVQEFMELGAQLNQVVDDLAEYLPSSLVLPRFQMPSEPRRTIQELATPSQISVVSVGREGVSAQVAPVAGGVGLTLTGPSSGSESFAVTLAADAGAFGRAEFTFQARLAGGIPQIQNLWVHAWSQIGLPCPGFFQSGTATLRVQLSEAVPAVGEFIRTSFWGFGSGSDVMHVSALREVGDRLYEYEGGFCWGGPNVFVDHTLQYRAPDGTLSNAFTIRMPRP